MKRSEYPRPQLVREEWMNLNGTWDFAFDDEDKGLHEKWYKRPEFYDQKIEVPFVYQAKESGIGIRESHAVVWYYRTFTLKKKPFGAVILHFGAVDYLADVYINGEHVTQHKGGNTSFSLDISPYLVPDACQSISLRVYDAPYDESQPRGKQFWQDQSAGIWYTNSTGIWQTVWLEMLSNHYIRDLKITPMLDEGGVLLETNINKFWKNEQFALEYLIKFRGQTIVSGRADFHEERIVLTLDIIQNHIFRTNYHGISSWLWSPETPNLFDIELRLVVGDKTLDTISSYFGMRKVHTHQGVFYLNNQPYYQKLVLDQGYWPDGLLTAPTDEDFVKDITLMKAMGFNGCRKHQKCEDPRFYYWADTMGFLVWGEYASPAAYTYQSATGLMHEWSEVIDRYYNHPSLVTWVPINESWGVPDIAFNRQQQHFSQAMYHYLHALDTTRLVISNDGWAMTESDICAIHNYNHGAKDDIDRQDYFKKTLSTREDLLKRHPTPWPIFAEGFHYNDQPILLTEFGGIGFDVSGEPGWGYTSVSNADEFIAEYQRIMEAVYASRGLWGFCYTQLTDVEQEINGLLTYRREAKCDLSIIKAINDSFHFPHPDDLV